MTGQQLQKEIDYYKELYQKDKIQCLRELNQKMVKMVILSQLKTEKETRIDLNAFLTINQIILKECI